MVRSTSNRRSPEPAPEARPRAERVLATLRAFESRNVTFIEAGGRWPIVWERARGVWVWDVDGRKYLDLTAAFGVAASGHANRRVVRAGQRQLARLPHAMGDVHPHPQKAALAAALSDLTFGRWARELPLRPGTSAVGKVIFGSAGFEAVEAALKTALLATGRPGVIAFDGAYHGLGYGAVTTTHREHFRSPFRRQLREFATFARYPQRADELASLEADLHRRLGRMTIGAVLAEPLQARGGIRIPADGFLRMLRRVCDDHGALLVLDEIYTGMGRTGRWFACEQEGVVPDVICLGKALTGGFPLSACVGRAEVMDAAWPKSTGEAIHTSTFLGHPVGCAMALAQIAELTAKKLVQRTERLGDWLLARLQVLPARGPGWQAQLRGRGLMAGVELLDRTGQPATKLALHVVQRLLEKGYLFLPEGEHSNVVSFTPPLTIRRKELAGAVDALARVLAEGRRR